MSQMSCLQERIQTKTLHFVLLTMATAGIYPMLWLYRYYPVINEVTETKYISETIVIWVAVCFGISALLLGSEGHVFRLLSSILGLAGNILYVVCAFKMRTALQEYALKKHKVNLSMNRFYTFLFSFYYVNYCINSLEETT